MVDKAQVESAVHELYQRIVLHNVNGRHSEARATLVAVIIEALRGENKRCLELVDAVFTECQPPAGVPQPVAENWKLTRVELRSRMEKDVP